MTDRSDHPETESAEEHSGDVARAETDKPPREGTGIAWGLILLLIGIAAVAVFAAQNTDPVTITFLWLEGAFPLSIVILVVAAAAVLLTELASLVYRRRRRVRRAEKEELRRLRGGSAKPDTMA
jgi:uncharacterized integral membrane protein